MTDQFYQLAETLEQWDTLLTDLYQHFPTHTSYILRVGGYEEGGTKVAKHK